MRLSKIQSEDIVKSIEEVLGCRQFSVYLYGSRIRDDLAGGDIDLVLVVPDESFKKNLSEHIKILTRIKDKPSIGDRRVDLKISGTGSLGSDPFIMSIANEWIDIWQGL